jgi:hypothetical protein
VTWLAILLSLAAFGGGAGHGAVKPTKQQCKAIKQLAKQKQCLKAVKRKPTPPKAKPKPGAPQKPGAAQPNTPGAQRDDTPAKKPADPDATPTPTPGASPTPAPTATATPAPIQYPSRTGVELTDTAEWSIRLSDRILAAGKIDFVTTNAGEDDHNLSVRAGGRDYGRLDLAPGRDDTLTLSLAAGTYTLYCSLTGHEELGMRATISVR